MTDYQKELDKVLGYAQHLDAIPPGRDHQAQAIYEQGTTILKKLRNYPNFESFAEKWNDCNASLKDSARSYRIQSAFVYGKF
jgi:hypothetical protein